MARRSTDETLESMPASLRPAILQVFNVWLESLPPGTQRDLTRQRAKYIRHRLDDSDLEELLDAVRGWQADPWPGRAQWNDLIYMLRNREAVERFRDLWRAAHREERGGRDLRVVEEAE